MWRKKFENNIYACALRPRKCGRFFFSLHPDTNIKQCVFIFIRHSAQLIHQLFNTPSVSINVIKMVNIDHGIIILPSHLKKDSINAVVCERKAHRVSFYRNFVESPQPESSNTSDFELLKFRFWTALSLVHTSIQMIHPTDESIIFPSHMIELHGSGWKKGRRKSRMCINYEHHLFVTRLALCCKQTQMWTGLYNSAISAAYK